MIFSDRKKGFASASPTLKFCAIHDLQIACKAIFLQAIFAD
jgi:hypothetical protein